MTNKYKNNPMILDLNRSALRIGELTRVLYDGITAIVVEGGQKVGMYLSDQEAPGVSMLLEKSLKKELIKLSELYNELKKDMDI